MLQGIGSGNKTFGKFDMIIRIDGERYSITMHVVLDELITYDMLIGADFLNKVN